MTRADAHETTPDAQDKQPTELNGRDLWGSLTGAQTPIYESPVGLVVLDARTVDPLMVNHEARRIIGELWEPGERPNTLPTATLRRADGREMPLAAGLQQCLASTEPLPAEKVVLARPDGRSVSVLVDSTPILSAEGTVESCVFTLKDMTLLGGLDRLRADLVARVGEELRAALAMVKGCAATVLESRARLDMVETAQFVRIIERQTDRMRDVLAELLDLARIETGTMPVNLEPTELPSLIEETVNVLAAARIQDRVEVAPTAGLPLVMADRRRIAQVLDAVASVALRLWDGSAPVRVGAARGDDHVVVSIMCPRPAVTDEQLADLFKPVPRFCSDGRGRDLDDGGLGLAVSTTVMEAHGGRLGATNCSESRGVRFTLTLPIAHPDATGESSHTQPAIAEA